MSRIAAAGGVLLSLFSARVVPALAGPQSAPRPNVVLVMTDDQGFGDVGVHGNHKIRTPNLDRFAREGIEFTRFYCSPVCAPTRASLMTGRYYYRSGVIHTSRGGAKMHGAEVTLTERLAKAGYRTGIFGKWHLGDNFPMRTQDQGFQETLVHKSGGIGQTPDKPNSYFDPLLWKNGKRVRAKGYCTDVFFSAALQFIEKHRSQRFFVYLPTNAPHTPLEVARTYSAPYRSLGLHETTARVYGMLQNIDENFGRLLKKLDELKLRDRTLIVFLSDNGPQQRRFNAGLRGRKASIYEGGLRVPCFVQWPGHLTGRRRIDRIAAHIDLAPTILALCGVEQPAKPAFDGVSLAPLLKGTTKDSPRRELFFQCHRGLSPTLFRNCAVVTQRFKLVGGPGTFARPAKTNGKPVQELYDLKRDPGETKNVIDKYPGYAKRLASEYRKWFADVKATRNFTPGTIRVGSNREDPIRLCRYQDGAYRDGASTGWPVQVVRGGRFRLTFRRNTLKGPGVLHCRWNGSEQKQPRGAGQNTMDVRLSKGAGLLDVWWEDAKGRRVVIRDNSTTGDVELKRIGP